MADELRLLEILRQARPGYAVAARTFSDADRATLDLLVEQGRVCRGSDAFMQTGYWLPEEPESKTIRASQLKTGMKFTYVGAFVTYWAVSGATPDPAYPGKVRLRGVRHGPEDSVYLDIRLGADQLVEEVSS